MKDPEGGKGLEAQANRLREEERWTELVELYLEALEGQLNTASRLPLYHRLATVYERDLHDIRKAFPILQQAFAEAPHDDETAVAVERVARRIGELGLLISSTNEILGTVTDEETRVALSARLGRWYQEVQRPRYAEECLVQALSLRPDHLGALKSLASLYRSEERREELVELLAHVASVAAAPEDRCDALVSLGELFERALNDPLRAAISYQEALGADPLRERAADGLGRTGTSREQRAALATALEAQLEDGPPRERSIAVARILGRISAEDLGDAPRAIAAYQRLLELDPKDGGALKELDGLLTREERWEELVPILERRAAGAPSERERVNLLILLALLFEDDLHRPVEAAEQLEEVLTSAPRSEIALEGLERIYRDLGDWSALAKTCSRHIEATDEAGALVPLYREVALVHFEHLDDPLTALEALEAALALAATDVETLEALSHVHTSVEDWVSAEAALEQLIDLVETPERLVDYHYRLAQLLSGPLDEVTAAVVHLRRGLELDPAHHPSLVALRGIFEAQEEWHEASLVLEQLQDVTEDPTERAKLLVELATMNGEHLRRPARAQECYELAVDCDPVNATAATRLVALLMDQGRFEEAAPVLDRILRHGGSSSWLEPVGLKELRKLRGKVALALGDDDGALEVLRSAAEGGADATTLEQLADIHLRAGAWSEAYDACHELLVLHRDELSDQEKLQLFHHLGIAKLRLGEPRRALNMFEKALAIDPDHEPTLKAVLAFHVERGHWQQVVQLKKVILLGLSGEERVEALVDVADLSTDRLEDVHGAIRCVEDALDIAPERLSLLHRLVDLTTSAGAWREAVGAIDRIVEHETDRGRLARYHRTAGVILRDRLEEPERALDHFDRCLDNDPLQLKSFEGIDRILTEQKDWERLEKAYRRMLGRIKGAGQETVELQLWHGLGEIYRSRLGELDAAAEAFRMAKRLDPEDLERRVILAELYESIPGEAERAIKEHQMLIRREPTRLASYKALRALYHQTEQYDKEWCLCAALCFIDKASADERLFHKDYIEFNLQRSRGTVGPDLWVRDLFAPEENLFVGKVFEAILPALRRSRVQPHQAYALRPKDAVAPAADMESPSGLFTWAAHALGMSRPDLYLKSSQPAPFLHAPTEPPASIAALSAFSDMPRPELCFELAHHLTLYRSEHYVRCLEPNPESLGHLLVAAIRVVRPEAALPGGVGSALGRMVAELRGGLTGPDAARLSQIVDKLLARGEPVDMQAWVDAVETTACRAGFLLCADLPFAARLVERHLDQTPGPPVVEAVARLVAFSVSESYFRLRQAVGFSIEQDRVF